MFLKFTIFCCSLFCIASSNILAQDRIKTDTIRHTTAPPITVTSDAYNDEIAIHPDDIHTIKSDQLQAQSGATRLSDALQVLHPSLDVRNYGSLGGISLASFRGLPAEYTSVYWEGICITDPQHSFTDLALIDLKSVQSVGIISAANSQLIGGDVAGAGVLLSTDPSARTSGIDIGTSVLSYTNLSSFSEKQLDLSGVGKIGEKFCVAGGLNTAYSDGAFPFLQRVDNYYVSVLRENNDAYLLNANASADYTIDSSVSIKGFSYFAETERGAPYVATIDNRGASNFLARQYDENFLLVLSIKHAPLPYFNYSINAGYQSQYETYSDPAHTPVIADRYLNRIYSFVWKSKTQIASWSDLYSGVDYIKNLLFSNENSLSLGDTSIVREHYAAYLSDKIHFLENLDATISLRTELLSDINKPQVLPGMSIYYFDPLSLLRLQGSYGRIYHAPTFNELYWRVGGNPHLLPESGTSGEFSGGITIPLPEHIALGLQIAIFETSLNNQIIWQEGKNGISTPSNIQSSKSQGIEFIGEVRYPFLENYILLVREGASLMKARNLSPDSNFFGKELPYSTPMRSSFLFQIENSSIGSLALTILYRGHRYKDYYNDPYTKLPPVTLFDLTYSSATINISTLLSGTARLSLLNLGNTQYQEIPNFPLPRRSIRLGIDLHFL